MQKGQRLSVPDVRMRFKLKIPPKFPSGVVPCPDATVSVHPLPTGVVLAVSGRSGILSHPIAMKTQAKLDWREQHGRRIQLKQELLQSDWTISARTRELQKERERIRTIVAPSAESKTQAH
jgi:hypothetical protein